MDSLIPDWLLWSGAVFFLMVAQYHAFRDVWRAKRACFTPHHDFRIHELLQMLFPRWNDLQGQATGNAAAVGALLPKIRQLATDGHLTIWGRAGLNEAHYPLVKIPPTEWLHMQIDYLSLVGGTPKTSPLNQVAGVTPYYDLWLDREQCLLHWPSRRRISWRCPVVIEKVIGVTR